MNNNNETNYDEYNYIDTIISKLDTIEDNELKDLIIKLIEERNHLITVSNIDPLTGVYNRRIISHIRDFTSVAVCDADDFKQINDTLGHAAGDMVLQEIAKTLIENSRSNDYVCRYGGDEFLVIFCGADKNIVKKRMNDVVQSISNQTNFPNYDITISVGISSYKEGDTLESVINEADQALYVSKQSGKNAINCYDELSVKSL